jgi:hypothetical protein
MKVLTVGLSYSGKALAGVEIENLGLCRAEVNEKRAAYPLYEYDVIIINPESYTHFLFGNPRFFPQSTCRLPTESWIIEPIADPYRNPRFRHQT